MSCRIRGKFPEFEEGHRSTRGVIHRSFAKSITDCLKNPSTADKGSRFYVRNQRFKLLGPSELVGPAADDAEVCMFI